MDAETGAAEARDEVAELRAEVAALTKFLGELTGKGIVPVRPAEPDAAEPSKEPAELDAAEPPKPAVEKPAAKKNATKKPTAKKNATKKSAAKKLAAKKPAVVQSGPVTSQPPPPAATPGAQPPPYKRKLTIDRADLSRASKLRRVSNESPVATLADMLLPPGDPEILKTLREFDAAHNLRVRVERGYYEDHITRTITSVVKVNISWSLGVPRSAVPFSNSSVPRTVLACKIQSNFSRLAVLFKFDGSSAGDYLFDAAGALHPSSIDADGFARWISLADPALVADPLGRRFAALLPAVDVTLTAAAFATPNVFATAK